MTGAIRRIGIVSMAAIGVLALWLTAQQTVAGSRYADDPRNVRALPDPGDPRGSIVTADGVVVAEDTDTGRVYAGGPGYLHLVGVVTPEGPTGLERTRGADLRPLDDGSITAWLLGVFGASLEPPEVRLTVVDAVQQAALAGMGTRTGAVVALDPRTGAVLAYVSSPSFDPGLLASGTVSLQAFESDPGAVDRVAFRLLPAGSTFKTIVAAAALADGLTPDSELEDAAEYTAPGGLPITNAGGGTCGDGPTITLFEAMVVSCNTVFARLAVEVGGAAIVSVAEAAGFNERLPFEFGSAISSIPEGAELDADPGALAQTGLGERDVRVTPLQMAVLAAAIGNEGRLMEPHIVDRVVTRDGTALETTNPRSTGRAFAREVAAALTEMMVGVVEAGTGRAAALPDVTVAGKTGTAEGTDGNHAWFIAFAPADAPTIALAVVVEDGGSGGSVAAPIARQVMEAWFEHLG